MCGKPSGDCPERWTIGKPVVGGYSGQSLNVDPLVVVSEPVDHAVENS
ncbi:MAG: hypothetical protein K8S94_07025 [Planctomycetia bacterium]|nr:hypothetical protein [Planctomycetia bacterium]